MKLAFSKILVPVDFSPASADALAFAFRIAGACEGATVEVVNSWMMLPGVGDSLGVDVKHSMVKNARDGLAKMFEGVDTPANVTVHTRVVEGDAWRVIVELSGAYDLIVMGTHGRSGLDRWLLGSTAERVVRQAKCPVLTTRNQSELVDEAVEEPQLEHVVRGMVDDGEQLRGLLAALVDSGVSVEDVSIVMSEEAHEKDFAALDTTKAKQGATAGGLLAGSVGGILGGLAGIGSVITTGGLALMVLGPAVGFAAVGGAVGALLGRTVPGDEAAVLRAQLVEGRRLVAVHTKGPQRAAQARELIKEHGGEVMTLD